MAITVQALQADGTWAVRNAFITENKMLVRGLIKAADLEAKARHLMGQWQQSVQDGRQLRVHNSDKDDPKSARKLSPSERIMSGTNDRDCGTVLEVKNGCDANDHVQVHWDDHSITWHGADQLTSLDSGPYQREPRTAAGSLD